TAHARLQFDLYLREEAGPYPVRFLILIFFFLMIRRPRSSTFFPYTTLFRSFQRSGRQVRSRSGAQLRRQGHLPAARSRLRSEEHTSELQSLTNLVCRLLL